MAAAAVRLGPGLGGGAPRLVPADGLLGGGLRGPVEVLASVPEGGELGAKAGPLLNDGASSPRRPPWRAVHRPLGPARGQRALRPPRPPPWPSSTGPR